MSAPVLAESSIGLASRLERLAEPLRVGEAFVPACRPEDLGDPGFRAAHGLRYAYASGAMANGIASCEIVEAMARAGMVGFFGAAGLPPARVESAIDRLQSCLSAAPHGFNLIHSPNEQDHERAIAELYLRRGVRLVEASAYLGLTPAIVRYRVAGLRRLPSGEIAAENRVVAKVSRVEVAAKFLAPAPPAILSALLAQGEISPEQAALAGSVAMCDDLTVEADSGGHTDNRPLVTVLPTMIALRDRLQAEHRFAAAPRVGAAGGIATPAAAAAAFMMGAGYVVTGSVNQACVESGSSDLVRRMLAEAGQADTAMAPAADMFEMGVKVQILKRGTMFAMRAAKLYELYRGYGSLEDIPAAQRAQLERELFRAPLAEIWAQTREYFLKRDPAQAARGDQDPKHRMALVFRWYLGQASRWANAGEPSRQLDYQVWCGPAMGAFNEWAKDSCLEAPAARRVALVARNLLFGAAYLTRVHALRVQGVPIPSQTCSFSPRTDAQLDAMLS